MFVNFIWHLGKIFQMIALTMGGYSLYVGLSTNDAKRELALLLASVALFVAGLILVRYTESKR